MDKRSEFDTKLEELIDYLDDVLPNTDIAHRDEVLDIASLLKARATKFADNYGLN